jgi:hypothetical protein
MPWAPSGCPALSTLSKGSFGIGPQDLDEIHWLAPDEPHPLAIQDVARCCRRSPLAWLLGGLIGLVAGSALAGHSGARAALLGETVAIAVLSMLLAQALAPSPRC